MESFNITGLILVVISFNPELLEKQPKPKYVIAAKYQKVIKG